MFFSNKKKVCTIIEKIKIKTLVRNRGRKLRSGIVIDGVFLAEKNVCYFEGEEGRTAKVGNIEVLTVFEI